MDPVKHLLSTCGIPDTVTSAIMSAVGVNNITRIYNFIEHGYTVIPQYLQVIGSRTPADTKIHGCSTYLDKTV